MQSTNPSVAKRVVRNIYRERARKVIPQITWEEGLDIIVRVGLNPLDTAFTNEIGWIRRG